MTPSSRRSRDRLGDERGSISVLAAALVPGLLLIIGLAVDGGAKVQAIEHADAIAEEAARAGGQALDQAAALRGQVRVDPPAAVAAAQTYLHHTGVAGTVTVVDGHTLTVDTTVEQPTVFLDLIGVRTFTVHGHGTAELVLASGRP